MAHNLTIRANGAAEFALVGAPAWHGLGNYLPENASMEEWRVAAGMDYDIIQTPVEYMHNGYRMVNDKTMLNIRSDNGSLMGVVSDQYKVVQPGEVLEFFRDLSEEAGMALETAGTLNGGSTYWALARVASDEYILDRKDTVGGYILLSTSADGSRATDARRTSVRVVCWNTLSAASRGKGNFRVTHKSEFDPAKAKAALGLDVASVREAHALEMETYRKMANKLLSSAAMAEATLRLLAGDKYDNLTPQEKGKLSEKKPALAIGGMAISGAGLIGSELSGANGTVWAWLNSVTQYVDHESRAHNTESGTAQNNRLDSAWFGKGATMKAQAFDYARELVSADGETMVDTKPDLKAMFGL